MKGRRRRMFWVGLALLVLGLGAGGLSAPPLLEAWTGETELKPQVAAVLSYINQPAVETADLVPVRYTGVNPFGVNTFLEQEVEEWKVRRTLELIRAAGIGWVRQQVPWADIEPFRKGEFRWEKYDRIFDLVNAYGLQLVARLDYPPDWSRRDNSVAFGPPDDIRDYGDFVEAFVRRYRGRVRFIQVWNEPNAFPEWGNRPVNATEYVALLREAYTRAKAVDPDIVVLSAALAPTLGTGDGRAESDLTFLEKIYQAGGGQYFDILAAQAYGLWTGPGDRRVSPDRTNFSRVRLLREIMVRHGDAAKPIWITELGWDALPEDFPGPATHGRVTRAQQARFTADAYRRILAEWPWVGVAFYWHFRMVTDEKRDQPVFYFGMADPDFTLHPVYYAVRDLATAPPVLTYGFRQEDDRAAAYTGDWWAASDPQASLGRYRFLRGSESAVRFWVSGSELTVVFRVGPDGGRAVITVGAVTGPSLRREVDLAAPEAGFRQVVIYRDWGSGPYRVEVRPADDRPVGIDGFIVGPARMFDARSAAGLVMALGALVAAGLAFRRLYGDK